MAGERWIPTTEDELRTALAGRVLEEGHYVDFKALIPTGDKGNLGLAIDLASFAVDSGIIIVGVDEKTDPPVLAPIVLAGLKERVDQVGRSRVDPPLLVACKEIPAAGRVGEGYLVVAVPASPVAPHMVDNVYRGRGDTTNIRLSDAEVRRIREQRRQGEFDIRAILRNEIDRDPITGEGRQNGHLFVVAGPVFADPEMLLPVVGDKWREFIHGTFRNGQPSLSEGFAPDISSGARVVRVPLGWALRSWSGERANAANDREDGTIELEVNENGGLRLYCARATDVLAGHGSVFVDPLIFGLVWRVVDWARSIAVKTGFVGNWRFAVGLTGVEGARSGVIATRGFRGEGTPYEADEYVEWTEATFAELENDPDRVVERLVGRLNRALTDGSVPLPTRA